MSPEVASAVGIVGAALGGAAIGVERERSGHAKGRHPHFAGIRTFTLLGGLAGVTGWLWQHEARELAIVLLLSAGALVVAAYVASSRRELDATTEVAALVVLAAGVLAGAGYLALASGIIAITTLLLVEKSALHTMTARIDDAELRAAARFAVMAIVILPLLPEGPYGPFDAIRPRMLWILVLLFSGLSFAGFIARRFVDAKRGYVVLGLLGSLVSSTGVTLTFAGASRHERQSATPLAVGVIAASTVMFLRVVVGTAILQPPLALAVLPYVALPVVVGAVATALGLRRAPARGAALAPPPNPLDFRSALEMAALFQVVFVAVGAVRQVWGDVGLVVSAAVVGLTDVDALTVSVARTASQGIEMGVAAKALTVGMLANTVLKLILALALGEPRFRRLAAAGLFALACATVVGLVLIPTQP